MQFDLASTCFGLLVGAITGAAGGYFANKFTDVRRKKEVSKETSNRFKQVATQVPDLLREMKQDLTAHPHVREFFVLLGGGAIGFMDALAFEYRDDNHPDLMGKVHILENHGYVVEVTPKNCPKYQMSEEFVALVLAME